MPRLKPAPTAQTTWTKYYFAGPQRIASRTCFEMTCSAPTCYLTDHLGSTRITTDSSGAKIAEMR
ncbi:MAG: hypothetical protein N2117_00405 [Anaerolineales bacterium]|nr:hypothetical protein [Anaerolineales bacterium]MCX7753690.1 hypothetical protein [Anaerolineales bacterium]MDW8276458.1 hypothetical protein [Anaerolineales bacterium]